MILRSRQKNVWVTYTGLEGHPFYGQWQSLELTQAADERLWTGSLGLNTTDNPRDIRFIVQACNSVGLCKAATNRDFYFAPGVELEPQPTNLALDGSNPSSGIYGSSPTFKATLTDDNSQPLSDQFLTFILGPVERRSKTDSNGVAQVSLPLLALPDADRNGIPDNQTLRVTFGGTAEYESSFATADQIIEKQDTEIALDNDNGNITGILMGSVPQQDGSIFNQPLAEETIFFIVRDLNDNIHQQASIITDFAGQAEFGQVNPPSGEYRIFAYFSGTIPRPPSPTIVDLVDDRYNPSDDAQEVIIVGNSPPEAIDDQYATAEDTPLSIAAPWCTRK